jgi:hypothetical protein
MLLFLITSILNLLYIYQNNIFYVKILIVDNKAKLNCVKQCQLKVNTDFSILNNTDLELYCFINIGRRKWRNIAILGNILLQFTDIEPIF